MEAFSRPAGTCCPSSSGPHRAAGWSSRQLICLAALCPRASGAQWSRGGREGNRQALRPPRPLRGWRSHQVTWGAWGRSRRDPPLRLHSYLGRLAPPHETSPNWGKVPSASRAGAAWGRDTGASTRGPTAPEALALRPAPRSSGRAPRQAADGAARGEPQGRAQWWELASSERNRRGPGAGREQPRSPPRRAVRLPAPPPPLLASRPRLRPRPPPPARRPARPGLRLCPAGRCGRAHPGSGSRARRPRAGLAPRSAPPPPPGRRPPAPPRAPR